jgi:hypothetical protein
MSDPITPSTELEAVNDMLATIGESPIDSLSEPSSHDAVTAYQLLLRESRAVQTKGWHFNREPKIPLQPDAVTGEIRLPLNILQLDSVYPSDGINAVQRGLRLYNVTERAYTFPAAVTVDMIIGLPFDELPEFARRYIFIRAGRKFQNRFQGDQILSAYTDRDEAEAWADFMAAEHRNADANMLTDSWDVAKITQRS